MRNIGWFRHDLEDRPRIGAKVVVRTERGVELGEVLAAVEDEPDFRGLSTGRVKQFLTDSGPEYPFHRNGRLLRLANPQDEIDHRHLQSAAREERAYCREQIRDIGSKMKLVSVEHLLGGERIIFYFTAEQRVDFRELVRRLASQYRTRIEMRQVGARDEARLVGDYERCGLRCCCQEYLKDLKPVSMRMAKTQKATLDPSKISGRCGRLMCCLRYEDPCYEELRKSLPPKNTWVRTEADVGKVVDGQILMQLVRLQRADGSQAVVPVEAIVERDVAPPPPPGEEVEKRMPAIPAERTPRVEEPSPAPEGEAAGVETAAVSSESPEAKADRRREGKAKPKKRRRRRGRPQKAKAAQKTAPQAGSAPSGGQPGARGRSGASKKRRARRRRKRKPRNGGGA